MSAYVMLQNMLSFALISALEALLLGSFETGILDQNVWRCFLNRCSDTGTPFLCYTSLDYILWSILGALVQKAKMNTDLL
jgi:hypothetical protein